MPIPARCRMRRVVSRVRRLNQRQAGRRQPKSRATAARIQATTTSQLRDSTMKSARSGRARKPCT
ncbi:hypothetical protein ACFFX0_27395 [Citricoccus parietis]|uniref:Uncharacterized protein n=1 Tax=Citricoccus parietis TaxID=592307 RepID=A0ABV5G6Z3_9MICC